MNLRIGAMVVIALEIEVATKRIPQSLLSVGKVENPHHSSPAAGMVLRSSRG
jgi:hypothetical protein